MRQMIFKGFYKNPNGNSKIYLNGAQITGEWVQGYYVACKDEYCDYVTHAIFTSECEHVCIGEYKDIGWYEVVPETVSQFTGLLDEHGTMIWENDIVKCADNMGLLRYKLSGTKCLPSLRLRILFFLLETSQNLKEKLLEMFLKMFKFGIDNTKLI